MLQYSSYNSELTQEMYLDKIHISKYKFALPRLESHRLTYSKRKADTLT